MVVYIRCACAPGLFRFSWQSSLLGAARLVRVEDGGHDAVVATILTQGQPPQAVALNFSSQYFIHRSDDTGTHGCIAV